MSDAAAEERKRCADLVRNAIGRARSIPVREVMTATAGYHTIDRLLRQLLAAIERGQS